MKTTKCFPPVNCYYGSPLGRNDSPAHPSEPVRLRLARAIIDAGGYDQGGVYWGISAGESIFCGWDKSGVRMYVRAKTPAAAAAMILRRCHDDSLCDGRFMLNGYAIKKDIYDAQSESSKKRIEWLLTN